MGFSSFRRVSALILVLLLFYAPFHAGPAASGVGATRSWDSEGLHIIPIENYGYAPMLKHLIDNATSYIHISMNVMSDYEPVKTLLDSLISAKNRGVDVLVIYEGDISSNRYAAQYLRDGGVAVKNDSSEKFIHTKMVVIDGRVVYLGSHNWSPYAMEKNNEYGVLIFNRSIAGFYEGYFQSLWDDANLTPSLSPAREESDGMVIETCYDGYTYDALRDLISLAQNRLYVAMYTMAYYSNPTGAEEKVDNLVNGIVEKRGIAKVILDDHDSEDSYDYLSGNGVDVIYDSSAVLTHLKLVIADDAVYIGDANWDTWYLDNDTHTVGVVIRNESVATFFAGYFLTIYKYGDAPYYIPDGFVERRYYEANPGESLSFYVYLANGGAVNDTEFHIVPGGELQVDINENPSWNRESVYDWIREVATVQVPSGASGNYTISLTFYSKYYHINYTAYIVISVRSEVPEMSPISAAFSIFFAVALIRIRGSAGKRGGRS